MNGPGKYDDACTEARKATQAEACLVIVLNGKRGSGFSVQASSPLMLKFIVDVLESMIAQMRESLPRES